MRVLLVGCGGMSQSYASVLSALSIKPEVVGRGEVSAHQFKEATGLNVHTGGLDKFLRFSKSLPELAIVAVGVEELFGTTLALLKAGIRRILVEKPGALDLISLESLQTEAASKNATVYIGYNRRYFSSTQKAIELASLDGGITSCSFEFTEWGHEIETLKKAPGVKERWLLSNSTHVIDLVFHLIGQPQNLFSTVCGKLKWHPNGAIFVGSGETTLNIPFSYHSNWDAPGRWGIELMTRNQRMILRPMESLKIMRKGSVIIEKIEIDDVIDRNFKPGLYRQVQDFLYGSATRLSTLDEQILLWPIFCKIGAYDR